MPGPDAAIIIPHYNDEVRLKRCLDALLPQLRDEVEAIVVDNNSPQTPDVPGPIRIVVETAKGAANARNRGVAETTAPYLFFLDSDCVPAADWVDTALTLRDRADLVGGKVPVFDETEPPRSGAQAFETVFAFDMRRYVEEKGFAGSGNLVTRRDVFEDVGGFIDGVSEDMDWSHRARAKGYRLVYADELVAEHPSRTDWPALRRKWRRLTQESGQLAWQRPNGRLKWVGRAFLMPFSAVAHLPKVLFSPRLDGLTERLRGAATLVRLRCLRAIWMLRQAAGLEI